MLLLDRNRSLFAAMLALLLAILPGSGVGAEPDVDRRVHEIIAESGKGAFLVTLTQADLSAVRSLPKMLVLAERHVEISDEMRTPDVFFATEAFHKVRGEYVFQTLQEHHENSRALLQVLTPTAEILGSIPISNTFKMVLAKEDVAKLQGCDHILEVNANETFDMTNEIASPVGRTMVQRGRGAAAVSREAMTPITMTSLDDAAVQWNIMRIGASALWSQSRGEGMTYAVADTGVDYKHRTVADNYKGRLGEGIYDHNYAWFDGIEQPLKSASNAKCAFPSLEPCDDYGHGTHSLSVAVGAGGIGAAPGAKWIACRNMDHGLGSPETYLKCLNFFLAPHDLQGKNARPELRPHSVGNSYGCPNAEGCSKHAMASAASALRAAGVFMSVSAGNDGPQCSTISDPPAIESSVVTVGSTGFADKISTFSSRGPVTVLGAPFRKPDLMAPGEGIRGAYLSGQMVNLSGTSMASPHVGGAGLLLQAICPCMMRSVGQLQHLLETAADHMLPPAPAPTGRRPPSLGHPAAAIAPADAVPPALCGGDRPDSMPNNYYGYGRINLVRAAEACKAICNTRSI